jgi:hypothetical protein
MVLVVTLLSVVGGVASYVIVEAMKVYARSVPAMDAAYQARTGLERMKREIRDLKDRPSIAAFSATGLTFDDSSDATIAYALSGSDLLRNGDLLARGVTALTFTYWKANGTAASAPEDLHLVEIDLTVASLGQSYRLETAIFPRVVAHD